MAKQFPSFFILIRRYIYVNKTYVWWGGTAQVLIMQAGSQFVTSGIYYYGYNSKYGSLTPSYIEYKGERYVISEFSTDNYNITILSFTNNLPDTIPTVTVEVNGVKYTLERMSATGNYRLVKGVFTSTGTYRIRILSIG